MPILEGPEVDALGPVHKLPVAITFDARKWGTNNNIEKEEMCPGSDAGRSSE
ncbi:MAG TPA: hypothetical protein VED17_00960 [Nitrososphaerales archaeon]|nr:hypothetical protein [Nitrososphaerales archaeon]